MLDARIHQLDLVALDLEATGVAHGHDRIVEIGATRFGISREGQVVPGPIFEALVDPELAIPEVVTRLTGIDDAMVRGKPTLDRVWPELLAFLGDGPRTVVIAHSARSDLAYLVSETLRLGLAMPPTPFLCTLELARRALPRAGRYGLAALRALTAPEAAAGGTFHRAVADALHTRNLFHTCVARAAAATLGDLGVKGPVDVPRPEDFAVAIPERLAVLEAAIAGHRTVRIHYRGGSKGRVARPVTPLAFFAFNGAPHLRAWCHLDDAAKTFRCDRISAVSADGDAPR